jgi:hypothetical protein
MEISQGNPLCSYLHLKLTQVHVFLFLFSLLQNGRTGGQNMSCPGWRGGISWRGKVARKRYWESEYSTKMYTHDVNAKMIPVERVP